MGVDPDEPGVAVTEIRAERLDVLAGVEEHGCVEVPQRVHSVLAGRLVPLALLGPRNDAGLDEGEFPHAGVENRSAVRRRRS